jgi:hypothetical protein
VAVAGPPLISGIVATDKWLTRFRTALVALLGATVLGIACLAFYTSFEAIRAYAVRSQGIAPEHAWAVPLMVDSFIVVALGADLWFTTTKARRAWWEVWWPKLLLAGAAGVSFILNVAHAEPTWAARGVALIPPAALVLGVELLMMVLRRATTIRAARLQVEAEAAHEAAMTAPLARIQIEAVRRPRRADTALPTAATPPAARPATAEAKAGALPRPAVRPAADPAGREPRRAPVDTFRQAVAAAKADDEARPRRRQAPYMVAAAILDERADAASLTAAQLVEAMARRGVTVSQSTAQALLRELRSPLPQRLSDRRPRRATDAPRPTGGGNGGGPGGGLRAGADRPR